MKSSSLPSATVGSSSASKEVSASLKIEAEISSVSGALRVPGASVASADSDETEDSGFSLPIYIASFLTMTCFVAFAVSSPRDTVRVTGYVPSLS